MERMGMRSLLVRAEGRWVRGVRKGGTNEEDNSEGKVLSGAE